MGAFVGKQQREQKNMSLPLGRCRLAPRATKMDSAPFPPLAENPLQFTNSIQWPWIQGGSGVKPSWSGDSNTVARTYSHFLLALLAFYWIHSSVRTHVCEGEGVHVHAVSHAGLLDLRVGGDPIHTTWIERAGELRVLFLEERERAGKNHPFPFMHLWSFQSAYQVVLEELRSPSTYYISKNLEMIPANADHTEVNMVYLYIAGAIINWHKVWKAIEQLWSIRIETACIIWPLVILRTYPRELTQI